ncbi:homocysteine S-methyltransferase [Streptomyces fradiae]|uniref:homocysteine S-methyltransferase n=1 Tax=Streptomyces fradiae TaxID=1906 RepID=UPI003814177A
MTTAAPPFADALASPSAALVLDGGLSLQLESAGHDLGDALWSARLLVEDPEALVAAHLAFYEAGADVVTSAGYQATFEGFARRGIGRERAAGLLALSVDLVRRAARRAAGLLALSVDLVRRAARRAAAAGAGRPLWVAASAGPHGAMLADGSEYRGRYGIGTAALEAFHRPRLEVLAAAAPDVLALETVPDADEARALLRAVRGLGVPAWLSYTVSGDRTRAGQPLEEAFGLLADAEEVVAVGVNCCAPEDALRAVEVAARVTGKPVVVYPNSGERWDAAARGWRGRPAFSADLAEEWREAGARLIGGCCRVGPDTVAAVAERLRGRGPGRDQGAQG